MHRVLKMNNGEFLLYLFILVICEAKIFDLDKSDVPITPHNVDDPIIISPLYIFFNQTNPKLSLHFKTTSKNDINLLLCNYINKSVVLTQELSDMKIRSWEISFQNPIVTLTKLISKIPIHCHVTYNDFNSVFRFQAHIDKITSSRFTQTETTNKTLFLILVICVIIGLIAILITVLIPYSYKGEENKRKFLLLYTYL